MKRLRCLIETFKKVTQDDSWEPSPWEGSSDAKPELEPYIIQGGIDAEDIQFYMQVRDDRIAVMLKTGNMVSVVSTAMDFEDELSRLGL